MKYRLHCIFKIIKLVEKFKISRNEPTACQTNKCGTEMISYKYSIHTTNLSMANSYFQKSQFCNNSMMPLSWYNSDISTYLEFWEKALVTGKCVFALMCICCLCTAVFTLDAGLLAISQYSEGPATGHLDTGFSWFPCVYKQMPRWFPRLQVATTCFSCSPPDLHLLIINFIFCIHVK